MDLADGVGEGGKGGKTELVDHGTDEGQLYQGGKVGGEDRVVVYDGTEGHHDWKDYGRVYHTVEDANGDPDGKWTKLGGIILLCN